jgi:hypothetical protein
VPSNLLRDSVFGDLLKLAFVYTNFLRNWGMKYIYCIEESNGLGQWITREEEAEVDVPLAPGKKFFRFSVKKD